MYPVGADSKSKEGATMTEGTIETIGCDLGDAPWLWLGAM